MPVWGGVDHTQDNTAVLLEFFGFFTGRANGWRFSYRLMEHSNTFVQMFFNSTFLQGLSWHAPSYFSWRVDCLRQQIFKTEAWADSS